MTDVLELDHPRLTTAVRLSPSGESDPAWEAVAHMRSGDFVTLDGTSAAHMLTVVDDLLDRPSEVRHVVLTVWMER